jgi:site-specific DNA-cytosine methylase
MSLISFQKLSRNRESPRLWLESHRLETLGFRSGTPFSIRRFGRGIRLAPALLSSNHVSHRTFAGRKRPIIDVASRGTLGFLVKYSELKLTAHFGHIDVLPSVRGVYIARRLRACPPFKTLEIFCGGGTLSAAVAKAPDFLLVAGIEIEPKFADVWERAHPRATLFQTDVRLMHPTEIPAHDVLIASIPCTSHSTLGRAKKSLAGKPELGDTGDLYLSVAHVIAYYLPAACIFENVPAFANSLACLSLVHHLKKMGYTVFESIVDPLNEWNEPQDRRRWIAVATLKPGFQIVPPLVPFDSTIDGILDGLSEADQADAQRIAGSIKALVRHRERHVKLGHGFGFTTINRGSRRVPTIVRSYHNINTGPFVETEHGLRLLRKAEVERLMGCEVDCDHYATAIEILGQGVQTRVFENILKQVAGFLTRQYDSP